MTSIYSVARLYGRYLFPKRQSVFNQVTKRTAMYWHYEDKGVYYADEAPPDPPIRLFWIRVFRTWLWWTIFYRFWFDPNALLGHQEGWRKPNPLLWTDEELGIPPDDYDEVFA